MVRPVSIEVIAGDFALAAGHRRIAISPLVGTFEFRGAFSNGGGLVRGLNLPPYFVTPGDYAASLQFICRNRR